MDFEDSDKLSLFLRNLADSIDNKDIYPQQLKIVGEFFMLYSLKDNTKGMDNLPEDNIPEDFSDKEALKFITLGWYIYTQILKDVEVQK